MKKLKVVIIALIVIILVAIFSFVSLLIYAEHFEKREIYRENSPDSEYEFILYQVGSPSWPFGPVRAQIKVVNSNGKTVDEESISIHNDGAGLYEYNIKKIHWYDTRLELECTGTTEHSTATYILEFE
ncbi:MAG: hypothetical protein IJO04_00410 [Oscillospiraceae bacterium]|nr:hypothetical protein [Oscillospiraceae bacterium]